MSSAHRRPIQKPRVHHALVPGSPVAPPAAASFTPHLHSSTSRNSSVSASLHEDQRISASPVTEMSSLRPASSSNPPALSPHPLLVLVQPEPPAQSGCVHHKMGPEAVPASLPLPQPVALSSPYPNLKPQESQDSDMLLLSAHQLELAAEANALLECTVALTATAAAVTGSSS